MSGANVEQNFQIALAHHRAGRLRQADVAYRQVLAARPDHADALHMLGFLAHQVGLNQAAVPLIRRAIEVNPSAPDYFAHLGMVLLSAGQLDDAIAACRQALALRPNNPEVYFHLGNALQAKGMLDQAVDAYRQSLALAPGIPQVHNNLAAACKQAGRADEAIAQYRQALAIQPDYVEALNNLGGALQDQGQFAEAIRTFHQALAINPSFAEARMSLGLALLLQGQFKEGWEAYESRRQIKRIARDHGFAQLFWDGTAAALAGRRILLAAEQGLGDTIQFVRYAPLVAACGGRILLHCKPELRRLLSGQCGIEHVATIGDPVPPFDLWCLLMSLPRIFGTTLATIPPSIPYLAAVPELARHWGEKMSREPSGRKVGLVWAGGPHNKSDRARSLPLAALAPLAQIPGVRFYSLQKGPASGQSRTAPAGMHLTDWTAELNDFADTAALIANLDLVISVDTAVAHLAGAMGKPAWVLLPFVPDFRWLLDRDDSPWYPTMRLFRQPRPHDWAAVLHRVADDLRGIPTMGRH